MKKLILTLMVVMASFTFYNTSKAARLYPIKAAPIVYNGIKYTAGRMNYVEAWDNETGGKLWELKIYDVIYDQELEKDVQDVVIIYLRIEEGKLIVTNERNEEYEVNLETKEINRRQKRRSKIEDSQSFMQEINDDPRGAKAGAFFAE